MNIKIKTLIDNLKPIPNDAVVVDVGGYLGDFTSKLFEKYNPRVILFEPHPDFFNECVKRLSWSEKVNLQKNALGNQEGDRTFYVQKQSSSLFKSWAKTGDTIIVHCYKLSKFPWVKDIHLLKLNCEGAEYEILEDIESLLESIPQILIQWHQPWANKNNYKKFKRLLSKSHDLVYNYKWDLFIKKNV